MHRPDAVVVRFALILLMLCEIAGCATPSERGTLSAPSFSVEPPFLHHLSEPEDPGAATATPSARAPADALALKDRPTDTQREDPKAVQKKEKRRKQEPAVEEEPYDPFETQEDRLAAAGEEYDPLEPVNNVVFEFNRKVDRYVLKPVAQVYDAVLPDELQRGIRNFLHNVRFVPRMMNNLFQGKFKGAGIEMGRFVVNTTFGVAGFMDFAKEVLEWDTPDEDLGQTLGIYGVKPGPYLIVPFLPPFTLRDFVGYVGDFFLDPINYLVFPSIEVDGAPSLIDHTDRWTTTFAQIGVRVGEIVNERALNLETYQGVEEATIDLYGAVRNAYLQRRAKQIRE